MTTLGHGARGESFDFAQDCAHFVRSGAWGLREAGSWTLEAGMISVHPDRVTRNVKRVTWELMTGRRLDAGTIEWVIPRVFQPRASSF